MTYELLLRLITSKQKDWMSQQSKQLFYTKWANEYINKMVIRITLHNKNVIHGMFII